MLHVKQVAGIVPPKHAHFPISLHHISHRQRFSRLLGKDGRMPNVWRPHNADVSERNLANIWNVPFTWVMHQQRRAGLGLLQGRHPSLALSLRGSLQMIATASAGQHQVAGLAHLYVCSRQGNGAAAGVGHLCLSPTGLERFNCCSV